MPSMGPGDVHSEENRARISEGVKRAYREGRGKYVHYNPPPSMREMYTAIMRVMGAAEARRIMDEHIRIRGIKE